MTDMELFDIYNQELTDGTLKLVRQSTGEVIPQDEPVYSRAGVRTVSFGEWKAQREPAAE